MSIKRYAAHTNIDDFKSDWHESKDGPMVKYSDYSALEQQLTALTSQLESVVAENAALKAAFDKPDAWLSWHSIPPTFYEPDRGGEYLQVHEQAGEKNDDGSDSWPVYRNPETETPATDAFLAEVRASGVEMFGQYHNFSEKLFIQKEAQKYAAQIRQEAK